MSAPVHVFVNGTLIEMTGDASVAAAVAQVTSRFRRSCTGMPRALLCGMGVCFECRVTIDDEPGVPACMTPVHEGMRVVTGWSDADG